MKKLLSFSLVVVLVLLLTSPVFGAVGAKNHGSSIGAATDINFSTGLTATSDGSTVTVVSSGMGSGVTTNVSTESNLTSAALAYQTILLQAGSAKSITLADGTTGQMLTLVLTVRDGKSITIGNYGPTMGAKTGWSTITFDTQGDSITLLYVNSTVGWIITGNNGCTVA